MLERFASRMPYRVFDPQALRDYCEHGLVPATDGDGYTLACDPRTEAAVYMSGRGNPGVYASVRALEIPVLIVRAKLPAPDRDPFDYSFSPTWPGLVGEFRHGREIHLPDLTHFAPMEAPERVAAIVREELALSGSSGPAPAPGG
jgi:pimeloyl-ACP methyl ester carboxylesterase